MLRRAEVGDRLADVVIGGDRIVEIVEVGRGRGDEIVDAAGGVLLPGLHDHHIHLLALAAARGVRRLWPARRERSPGTGRRTPGG